MSVGGGGLTGQSSQSTRHGNSVDAALSKEVLNSITGMCRVITGHLYLESSQFRLCLIECFILSMAKIDMYCTALLYVFVVFNMVVINRQSSVSYKLHLDTWTEWWENKYSTSNKGAVLQANNSLLICIE